MKHRILFYFLIVLLFSCGNNAGVRNKQGEGGRFYGGNLRLSESDTCQTLLPMAITDASSAFVATQIHEGLMKLDPATLQPIPAIAEKVETDPNGLMYTFTIRKGVFFHDDPCFEGGKGREVKAQDVKYSLELLCKSSPDNQYFSSTLKDRVVGANESFAASEKGQSKEVSGIQVIDDKTIAIQLQSPSTVFLQILAEPACAVIPREAVEKYGLALKVGCGAFLVDKVGSTRQQLILLRNPSYYGKDNLGNQLPFLDSVCISYFSSKEKEFEAFKNNELDMIFSIPSQSVKQLVEEQIDQFEGKNPKYVLDNSAEMTSQYYVFNTKHKPFDQLLVRQAFNLAIDRQRIIDEVLKGQAYGPGIKGITPPVFSREGYPVNSLNGYDYNPAEAKKLMTKAGYKDGKGFPLVKVELNSGGGKNTEVILEVQKQLKDNLGVELDFDVVSYSKKFDDDVHGRNFMMRDAWVADYPSPETFLSLFYGASVPDDSNAVSFPNIARYKSSVFDNYFAAGRDARTKDSSYANFLRAEQCLLNDAALMVLWYEGNFRITRSRVKNYFSNGMRYRNYAEVYLQDEKMPAASEKP